jgi:hypothetical protein
MNTYGSEIENLTMKVMNETRYAKCPVPRICMLHF